MKSSLTAWRLIKAFEGFKEKAEKTPNGQWLIGYGHVKKSKPSLRITYEEGHLLLRFDLRSIEKTLNTYIHTVLSQNQFDALVSLVFNIGEKNFLKSDILRHLNAGKALKAAEAFDIWRRAEIAGQIQLIDALVRRRSAEKALFLTPDQGVLKACGKELNVHPDLAYALRIGSLSEPSKPIEGNSVLPVEEENLKKDSKSNLKDSSIISSIPEKQTGDWPEIGIEKLYEDSSKQNIQKEKVLAKETKQDQEEELTKKISDLSKDISRSNDVQKSDSDYVREQTGKQAKKFIPEESLEKPVFQDENKIVQTDNNGVQKISLIQDMEPKKYDDAHEPSAQEIHHPFIEEDASSTRFFSILTLVGLSIALFGIITYMMHAQIPYIPIKLSMFSMLSGVLITAFSLYFWYKNHHNDHDDDHDINIRKETGKKYTKKEKKLRDELKFEDHALRNKLSEIAKYSDISSSILTN